MLTSYLSCLISLTDWAACNAGAAGEGLAPPAVSTCVGALACLHRHLTQLLGCPQLPLPSMPAPLPDPTMASARG